MSAIEARTIKAIQTGRSVLSLGPMEYMGMLEERYGVTSSKELTEDQGRDLIEYFRSMGFGKRKGAYVRHQACKLCAPAPPKVEGIPADVIYPASMGQLAVIDACQRAVKWRSEDGFTAWLRKYFHIEKVEWSPQATRVITALKGLLRSQKTGCSCPWKREDLPQIEE